MATDRTLILFPASLHGGYWETGPRVRAELVSLHSALLRAGVDVGVLDLENSIGNPGANDRESFMSSVERQLGGLAARGEWRFGGSAAQVDRPPGEPTPGAAVAPWPVAEAGLIVISCSSSLQYTTTLAVADMVRRLYPEMPLAVAGFHVTARPTDFTYQGAPFDWVVVGEPEKAVVELAGSAAGGTRQAAPVVVEGTALELSAATAPDFRAYPYVKMGLTVLQTFLSRGCPFPLAACQLRPGSPGWRAYPPEVAARIIGDLTALQPGRIEVLDPSFGLDPAWRTATLQILERAEESRRSVPLSIGVRPEAFTRDDVDAAYRANLELRIDVGTLSIELLRRTGVVPQPEKHVRHTLDLLEYVNAKGLSATVELVFNRPGETRATAEETLDALEAFVQRLPNTSLRSIGTSWVYVPYGEPAAEIDAPRERYGTVILHPEWWREGIGAERAAKAVIASSELADLEAGDESYWRPRFDAIAQKLVDKLTAEARRGVRSHESVGSEATGVPHGFWVEPRWH
jgi:hypothetical protein